MKQSSSSARMALVVCCALAACARQSTPTLLPTRVVQSAPPTVLMEVPRASVATVSATSATRGAMGLPTAAPPPAASANAITSATLRDLKAIVQRNEAGPRVIIAVADDRVLALQKPGFAVLSATDFKLLSTIPFTLADADTYWFAGSANTRRAALLEKSGTLTVFDTDSGKTVTTLTLGKVISSAQADIALTPDGKSLLYVNGEIQLVDLATGKATIVGALPAMISRIVLSMDASRIAALTDRELVLISTTGKPSLTLALGQGVPLPRALYLSPNGSRVALGMDDDDLRIWHTTSATPDKPDVLSGAAQAQVNFSNGALLAIVDEDSLMLYDTSTGKITTEISSPDQAPFIDSFFTQDERMIIAASESGAHRFDVASGKSVAQTRRVSVSAIVPHPDGNSALAFSGFAPIAAFSVLDARTGTETRTITLTAPVRHATYSSSGKYALAFETGGSAEIWSTADWKLALRTDPSRTASVGLCINADETEYIKVEGGDLVRYPLAGGAPLKTALPFEAQLVGGCSRNDLVMLGRDDKLAVFTTEGKAVLDVKLDKPLRANAARLLISPNGRYAAVATATEIQLWDVSSGARLFTLPGRSLPATVQFTPSSHRLLIGFPAPRGSRIEVIEPNTGTFNTLTTRGFSSLLIYGPDKDMLGVINWLQAPGASTVPRSFFDYSSSEISFLDLDSGRELRTIKQEGVIVSADLSARGDTLMIGNKNGDLTVFAIGR